MISADDLINDIRRATASYALFTGTGRRHLV